MKRANIVVVGSLNMDLVASAERMPEVGETISGTGFHTIPGGKGANQAVGCAKLGASVMMLGAVGDDFYGQAIVKQLEDHQIDTSELAVLPESTGIASIIHTPDDNCIVVVPGANGAFDVAQLASRQQYIEQAKVLVVQLEIGLPTVERAMEIAHAKGVTIILNPAPAAKLPVNMLKMAHYITPNETELEALSGQKIDDDAALEAVLRDWEASYGSKIIVTRGAAGCSYIGEGGLCTVPAPKVEVRDTTGAGDAFNGALAFGLQNGWELARCVKFAVTASSLSVCKFGAQAGMPTLAEVEERLI
ncbi:ribokinase [Paenibacillus sp. GCM10027626]|uniref:ribokinase n=1 Tax=Paenibacillus sp. GCM10027626 TaxID=3273411 RepID=UPI003636E59D